MLVLVFIICCVLYYWNNENIKKAQGFPIEDRNQLRRKKLRLFLSLFIHYCILNFVLIYVVEFAKALCGSLGYDLILEYEERDRIVKILALIITILRIPKIKRNIIQNTSTNTNNNINDDINNNLN